ncbi:hypothetical protein A7U60_g6554 [Sanghuangporus baumii]|uniref:Proteasome maturation factor UMP1 n=1 Tax=Sanghuangporus baumii TaxID=108892 RepID=A0A9Q5N789_SANBA|nr:hypothetical protein A7U60_g6554 [Sanghuangporus baumii]
MFRLKKVVTSRAKFSYAVTRVESHLRIPFLHLLLSTSQAMDSFRLVPSPADNVASVQDTSSTLGLHDSLRYGPRNLASEAKARSDIQHRLEKWEETQDNLKLQLQRDLYGMGAPIRLMMERKITSTNMHMPALARSNIHLDILTGRDEILDVHDVFQSREEAPPLDIHSDMERKLRM